MQHQIAKMMMFRDKKRLYLIEELNTALAFANESKAHLHIEGTNKLCKELEEVQKINQAQQAEDGVSMKSGVSTVESSELYHSKTHLIEHIFHAKCKSKNGALFNGTISAKNALVGRPFYDFLRKSNMQLKKSFSELKNQHFCHKVFEKTIISLLHENDGKFENSRLLRLLEENLEELARQIIKKDDRVNFFKKEVQKLKLASDIGNEFLSKNTDVYAEVKEAEYQFDEKFINVELNSPISRTNSNASVSSVPKDGDKPNSSMSKLSANKSHAASTKRRVVYWECLVLKLTGPLISRNEIFSIKH